MNTFIVFSFNLVSPCCQILTIFILGVLPNKKKKNKNGPSQQVFLFVTDTAVIPFLCLTRIPRDKIKLLITVLAQGYVLKSRNNSFFSPQEMLKVYIKHPRDQGYKTCL